MYLQLGRSARACCKRWSALRITAAPPGKSILYRPPGCKHFLGRGAGHRLQRPSRPPVQRYGQVTTYWWRGRWIMVSAYRRTWEIRFACPDPRFGYQNSTIKVPAYCLPAFSKYRRVTLTCLRFQLAAFLRFPVVKTGELRVVRNNDDKTDSIGTTCRAMAMALQLRTKTDGVLFRFSLPYFSIEWRLIKAATH